MASASAPPPKMASPGDTTGTATMTISTPPAPVAAKPPATETDATKLFSDFAGVVASLRDSLEAETVAAATAADGPAANGGADAAAAKTSAASALGKLKIMYQAMLSMDVPPTMESMTLQADLAEVAHLCLPQDTRNALEACSASNDVALELVSRHLTQLPALAKKLYQATPEALAEDPGFTSMHGQLAPSLELYGALVSRGINPRRKDWAKKLVDKFSCLSELRWISWRRLMRILDMDAVELEGDPAEAPGHEDEEAVQNLDGAARSAADIAAAKQLKSKKGKAALSAALPVARLPDALSKGELTILQTLYAVGTDAPPIRKQALDFGLGLDAAEQLEDAGITTSLKLSESLITGLQTTLKIPGKTSADVKSALMAMLSNKTSSMAASSAVADNDDDSIFGSYDTNEELVAAAGGGMALYGINFFPNANDVTLKPYAPILKKPTFIEMAGSSASFEASVLHSTEQSMASTFTKTTENGGISIAQSSSTSWGVSASVSTFGGAASAEVCADGGETEDSTQASTQSNAFSANNKKTTTSATTVETITCPMKSFRIPVMTMKMTDEALDSAMEVDTLLKAGQYLDTFGSHISNGRHLLGGIFFRSMTLTTESEVDTSTLLAAGSVQMEQSKAEACGASASGSGPSVGISAEASATMKSASSSGVVTFHSSAGRSESESADCRAMFQTYVRSMGPNVATPELFAEALFTDTSTWTVIDRGPFEALLPITTVMENMIVAFDPASPQKAKLENAMNLLTVAWQQRAAAWKPLEHDKAVPAALRNMIGRSFATEDAHDEIRAAVIDLFEVIEDEASTDLEQAAQVLSDAVVATAKEMEVKPAGQADFFETLRSKITGIPEITGKYDFKTGSSAFHAAQRSAKKLSSSDWVGFDLIWKKRLGDLALKNALQNHIKFEEATLRYGEVVTIGEPLMSVNEKYQLEIHEKALRVVNNDRGGKVVTTIFEAEGTLGSSASAHMEETGALVLDLTMITGFDRTETRLVLWTAPGSDSIGRGSYARMQNDGKFVVFNHRGQAVWSTDRC